MFSVAAQPSDTVRTAPSDNCACQSSTCPSVPSHLSIFKANYNDRGNSEPLCGVVFFFGLLACCIWAELF